MRNTGIVIIAHGSRGEKGMVETTEVLNRISHGVKAFLTNGVEVVGAALQFNQPDLEDAVSSLVGKGAQRVIIVPYFLFPGRHITEHIPEIIEKMQSDYPGKEFLLAGNLGQDEYFVDLMANRILETAPELAQNGNDLHVPPSVIEQQSMAIVEKILPPLSLSDEERTVVMRLVHTAGDRHVASLVKFHPATVRTALSAIRLGKSIFTDVRMVSVAVNRQLAAKFGCEIHCALEESEIAGVERDEEVTRTAGAIFSLGQRLNGSIVAIGNSPTALLSLLKMATQKKASPAVVIGMPVGFVQAKEAKEKLMKMDIPYISIAGTRGGSALAAATVNALLKIALGKNSHAVSGP